MFLSIFLATKRPENLRDFLNNLAETMDDPQSFEVLIKIDEEDADCVEKTKLLPTLYPFRVVIHASPRLDGYYSLHVGYNELLKFMSPSSYFCWLLTDEIRFKSLYWDKILRQYVHHYSDDIFRLKLSIFQLKNYYDFFECLTAPDNYAVTTRRWLEVTGGWGNFWGPDSWHQAVDYYLGLCKDRDFFPHGVFRSLPLSGITIVGQEAGQGMSKEANRRRDKRIIKGWVENSTKQAQENFYRLAQLLKIAIIAHQHDIPDYSVQENKIEKNLALHTNTISYQANYAISGFPIKLYIGRKQFSIFSSLPKVWIMMLTVYWMLSDHPSFDKQIFRQNLNRFKRIFNLKLHTKKIRFVLFNCLKLLGQKFFSAPQE